MFFAQTDTYIRIAPAILERSQDHTPVKLIISPITKDKSSSVFIRFIHLLLLHEYINSLPLYT